MNQYVPVLILTLIALVTGLAVLAISMFIGPKIRFPEKNDPFECGEVQIVSPKLRFSVKFYLIALFFTVFDMEAAFLFPWAVVAKSLGIFGLIEMAIFIIILTIGLIYVWKKGALEWQ